MAKLAKARTCAGAARQRGRDIPRKIYLCAGVVFTTHHNSKSEISKAPTAFTINYLYNCFITLKPVGTLSFIAFKIIRSSIIHFFKILFHPKEFSSNVTYYLHGLLRRHTA